MRRISVRGTSGSGKSTLARKLSERLELPYVDLDSLYHLPEWQARPAAEFRELVREATSGEGWIVDGNYQAIRDLVDPRIDTLVWLDYPFPVTFGRLLRRTGRRCVTGELVCNGNRETLRQTLLTRDSILWWAVKTHRRRHFQGEAAMGDPALAHVERLRFRQPREAQAWFEGLPLGAKAPLPRGR